MAKKSVFCLAHDEAQACNIVDQLKTNEKVRAEGAFYAGLYVLGVNSKVPPLDNPKVKQALSLAIDRDGIVQSLWRGQGTVPNGFVALVRAGTDGI